MEAELERPVEIQDENVGLNNDNYDVSLIQSLDQLENVGINVSDIKKLKAAGFYTISSIMMATSTTLCNIKGLSEPKVQKIIECVKKMNTFGFCSAKSVGEKRKQLITISTGSTQFDNLLRGGIESQSITEIFGEFRTGKTQICHTLCVTAQLAVEEGGGNGKVMFIDTEGTFRPERIVDIANRFGADPDIVLDNISVARAFTHEHQMDQLTGAAARMVEEKYSLLIVDSATALFRVDFSGRGQLADRQQKLGQFLSRLTKLAEEFNIAVVITNQVVADPSGGSVFVADVKKPVGGHVMAHASTTRLMLRKGRGETRICKVYDSPCLPELEAMYALSEGGITDAKDM